MESFVTVCSIVRMKKSNSSFERLDRVAKMLAKNNNSCLPQSHKRRHTNIKCTLHFLQILMSFQILESMNQAIWSYIWKWFKWVIVYVRFLILLLLFCIRWVARSISWCIASNRKFCSSNWSFIANARSFWKNFLLDNRFRNNNKKFWF